MNERFAAEPATCDSAFELKTLLEKFGPSTGRYLVTYPSKGWEALLESHIEVWTDVERATARTVLRRAKEARALVRSGPSQYEDLYTWVENVLRVQALPSRYDGVVVSRASAGVFPSLDDLQLPPTAEDRIPAKAPEYVRASCTLLTTSPELHFIDAYLDPCDADRRVVLLEMIRTARAGRCEAVYVWARSDDRKHASAEKLAALRQIAVDAGFVGNQRRLQLREFTDAQRNIHVHDRYLLSLYGAIRFEHGFQELTGKRTANLSPQSPKAHLSLQKIYMEGEHDLGIEVHDVAM